MRTKMKKEIYDVHEWKQANNHDFYFAQNYT